MLFRSEDDLIEFDAEAFMEELLDGIFVKDEE